ncbi:MAG: hypothetical protein VX764_02935 [Planctomycetota bacterium]|nr:hypothetical protein [Planctomycetota bacterium]
MSSFNSWLVAVLLVVGFGGYFNSVPAQIDPAGSSSPQNKVWEIIQSHDDDGDGVVTKQEFDRTSRAFDRYDLNGDGRLTREEIEQWVSNQSRARGGRGGGRAGAGRGGAGNRGRGPTRIVGALGDSNSDGLVTREEWASALQAMTEQGQLSVDAFRARMEEKGLGRMVTFLIDRIDPDGSGFVSLEVVDSMFDRADPDGDGRIEVEASGGNQGRSGNPGAGNGSGGDGQARDPEGRRPQRGGPAPSVGDLAPDFVLPLATDAHQRIQLSKFTGKKPVALIFGSYT